MKSRLKGVLRDMIPPALLRRLKPDSPYGFFGDYASWEDAKSRCLGYDAPAILDKVILATRAVRDGRAPFERDSVLFQRPEYNWPLIASLLRIAAAREGSLRVLDFGGSLGSTYNQCRPFLSILPTIEWSVVEQPNFLAAGSEFENGELRFYRDIPACLGKRKIDCLLLSSVVQYLEEPFAFLSEIAAYSFDFLIIDRTPFLEGGKNRITIQKVPPEIYPASYPAWFFDRESFFAGLGGYRLIAEFESADRANIASVFKGFLLEKQT